jgi:ABC-type protease/lipase transport system fused ATPase/permease subunit
MAYIALNNSTNMEVMIALAATLPRQIEMTKDVYTFTSGWNELLASWARMTGVAENMHPEPDAGYDARIKIDRLVLREGDNAVSVATLDDAMAMIFREPTGRINVRGPNGAGKSTLLTSLKSTVKSRAYYWPTADRLAFAFSQRGEPQLDEDGDPLDDGDKKTSFSSGERQLRALQEIVMHTDAPVYLLDEWDANLDANNRAAADALVEELARRARVVEISHRDRA